MSGRPLISVITPSCNHGRFIERCIRSVLDQGYPAFEHVVYDNCSSDHTVAILRRYPHLIWASEPDRGQSHALNKALARAQGEIIGWINADDMYQPGAFEVAARELGAGSGVQAIAGRVHLLDQAGNIIRTKIPTVDSLDSLVKFWEPGFCLDQCGVFFRREVVEEIGGLDEELHYAMDYEFFLRLLARFRLKLVDAVLAGFTVHPDSKTGRGDRHWQFLAERQRASSRYWGPPGSRRYRQFSRACNRHLADQVAKGLLRAYRSGGQLDWRGLAKAAALDPSRLLSRPILGMLAERAVGPRVTTGLRQAGHARKKIPSTCSIWPVRWSQNPGSSDISV